ncbi:MAG: LytR C-terminal domain-containing protein [Longimicrobiales bacterium]|nr:LytR C-terminal domain-containing protein [Longimicrobiales bacterium]
MGSRIRGVMIIAVVLAVGAFLGSALSQWWSAPLPGARSPAGATTRPTADGVRVRVEVLNAGGRTGMAAAATDHLRDQSFDVVYFGNAEEFGRDSSVVVSRAGRVEWAHAVADALGIRHVRTEPNESLYLDVTVILGEEWGPAPPPADPAPSDPPWWDPRSWMKRPGAPVDDARMADPGESG